MYLKELLDMFYDQGLASRGGSRVTDLRATGNQSPLEPFGDPHEERRIGQLLEFEDTGAIAGKQVD